MAILVLFHTLFGVYITKFKNMFFALKLSIYTSNHKKGTANNLTLILHNISKDGDNKNILELDDLHKNHYNKTLFLQEFSCLIIKPLSCFR